MELPHGELLTLPLLLLLKLTDAVLLRLAREDADAVALLARDALAVAVRAGVLLRVSVGSALVVGVWVPSTGEADAEAHAEREACDAEASGESVAEGHSDTDAVDDAQAVGATDSVTGMLLVAVASPVMIDDSDGEAVSVAALGVTSGDALALPLP